jgi:predicted  nucleic acid-binding Zn-ribbon protein
MKFEGEKMTPVERLIQKNYLLRIEMTQLKADTDFLHRKLANREDEIEQYKREIKRLNQKIGDISNKLLESYKDEVIAGISHAFSDLNRKYKKLKSEYNNLNLKQKMKENE